MVLSFFKSSSGEGSFAHIVTRSVGMLGDARHSFDLASLAVITGAGFETVADDVRATDERINQAEQDLRRELVVHVAVQGPSDIGSVLGFTLLLKKIERIGDQAKNVLELAEQGVSFANSPEHEQLVAERTALSALFAEASELLGAADTSTDTIEEYAQRANVVVADYQSKIDEFMTSERPGSEVVPLAIYYRFLRRIAANLVGIVRTSVEPVPHIDYLEDGTVDTDD